MVDCIYHCSAWLPVQLECRDFRPVAGLLPTYKGNLPFECWCMDILKWGVYLLIVCVCAFSKWVEAGVWEDCLSITVARCMHSEIVCYYGTPRLVCTDCGTEFKGAFANNLKEMGVRQ